VIVKWGSPLKFHGDPDNLGSPQRANQVVCLKDLHHFLRSFQTDASSLACRMGQP